MLQTKQTGNIIGLGLAVTYIVTDLVMLIAAFCLNVSCKRQQQNDVVRHSQKWITIHIPQDITFCQKLSRQLPPHMTNCFCPAPRIPSFHLTLLGVPAVILTLRHVNQLFEEWMNDCSKRGFLTRKGYPCPSRKKAEICGHQKRLQVDWLQYWQCEEFLNPSVTYLCV